MITKVANKWAFIVFLLVAALTLLASALSFLSAGDKLDIASAPSAIPLFGLGLSLALVNFFRKYRSIKCGKVFIALQILLATLFAVGITGMFIRFKHPIGSALFSVEWYGTVALAILSIINRPKRVGQGKT